MTEFLLYLRDKAVDDLVDNRAAFKKQVVNQDLEQGDLRAIGAPLASMLVLVDRLPISLTTSIVMGIEGMFMDRLIGLAQENQESMTGIVQAVASDMSDADLKSWLEEVKEYNWSDPRNPELKERFEKSALYLIDRRNSMEIMDKRLKDRGQEDGFIGAVWKQRRSDEVFALLSVLGAHPTVDAQALRDNSVGIPDDKEEVYLADAYDYVYSAQGSQAISYDDAKQLMEGFDVLQDTAFESHWEQVKEVITLLLGEKPDDAIRRDLWDQLVAQQDL